MTEREHWNQEFAARFVRREDELKWLYCELYHNDMQAATFAGCCTARMKRVPNR